MEMTRFEYLVKQGPEQVAHDICWAVSEMYVHDECDRCPFKIRAEITTVNGQVDEHTMFIRTGERVKQMALDIIDKYTVESEESE